MFWHALQNFSFCLPCLIARDGRVNGSVAIALRRPNGGGKKTFRGKIV
jgi:hypothetical protein